MHTDQISPQKILWGNQARASALRHASTLYTFLESESHGMLKDTACEGHIWSLYVYVCVLMCDTHTHTIF